jgi:hypothetical protein
MGPLLSLRDRFTGRHVPPVWLLGAEKFSPFSQIIFLPGLSTRRIKSHRYEVVRRGVTEDALSAFERRTVIGRRSISFRNLRTKRTRLRVLAVSAQGTYSKRAPGTRNRTVGAKQRRSGRAFPPYLEVIARRLSAGSLCAPHLCTGCAEARVLAALTVFCFRNYCQEGESKEDRAWPERGDHRGAHGLRDDASIYGFETGKCANLMFGKWPSLPPRPPCRAFAAHQRP